MTEKPVLHILLCRGKKSTIKSQPGRKINYSDVPKVHPIITLLMKDTPEIVSVVLFQCFFPCGNCDMLLMFY